MQNEHNKKLHEYKQVNVLLWMDHVDWMRYRKLGLSTQILARQILWEKRGRSISGSRIRRRVWRVNCDARCQSEHDCDRVLIWNGTRIRPQTELAFDQHSTFHVRLSHNQFELWTVNNVRVPVLSTQYNSGRALYPTGDGLERVYVPILHRVPLQRPSWRNDILHTTVTPPGYLKTKCTVPYLW